jgi:hypothetical protein
MEKTEKRYTSDSEQRFKVRVINIETGREDIHENLCRADITAIKANPNLRVDFVKDNEK